MAQPLPGIRIPTIITVRLSNGQSLEAPTEAWVSAILLSVPEEIKTRIIEQVTQMLQQKIVGVNGMLG